MEAAIFTASKISFRHTLRFTRPGLAPFVLAGWFGILFLYGLAAGSLYRTESLRAIIGAEALRGHWLYPVLYGEPFLTKPPGHYAAIAICSLPSGRVSEVTARLPSALAATASVLCMFGLFRRVLGERAGWAVAFLLPTSILWLDKVPSAEIDMTLVGWVAAAMALLYRAVEAQGEWRGSAWYWLSALLCIAAGTLTKWTAPAFFYLTAIPLLAWRRQLHFLWGWRHLLAASAAMLLCVGWAGLVAREVSWDLLLETIRKEASYRFHSPTKARGNTSIGMASYPLLVLLAHLPLSIFALRTMGSSFFRSLDSRSRLLVQLLHCWTWPNLLFWTLVPNHNVRYALPLSPGLMGLGTIGFMVWCSSFTYTEFKQIHTRKSLLFGFLIAWLAVKIIFVEFVIPLRTHGHSPAQTSVLLRERIPDTQTLYLFRLKDEGILFYYDRPARKLMTPVALPPGAYALLIRQEWENRPDFGHLELLECMYDQQGDPIFLVRASDRQP